MQHVTSKDGTIIAYEKSGQGPAQAVFETLPHVHRRTLAGQPHNVADEEMAPVLIEYFQA